jgi:hypothetical protein
MVLHGDDQAKFISENATKTAVWVLKLLRTMIEDRWGMTIDQRG